jgi:hypothetical protein
VFETIDTSVEKDNTNDGELTEEEYVWIPNATLWNPPIKNWL